MKADLIYPTTPKKVRLKLLQRAKAEQLPRHRPTKRDRELIWAVYTHRALTTSQIETLLFPRKSGLKYGLKKRCQERLKKLYHHGYLWRDELPTRLSEGRRPLVYFLDQKGKTALCNWYGLSPKEIDWQPRYNTVSDPFIGHLLQTNDARIAVTLAAQQPSFKVKEWLDDKTLRKQQNKDFVEIAGPQGGKSQKVAIVPDGYVHLKTPQTDFHFLLEIDRRTVVGQYSQWGRKDWARKIRAYIAYFTPPAEGQPSLYEQRYGTPHLRILTVTTGQERLANLKRITETAGGKAASGFPPLTR